MIYSLPDRKAEITQGDILNDCPIISWELRAGEWILKRSSEQVIVLTQACDLANTKTTQVQVALVHSVERIIAMGIVKASVIRDQVRRHRVFGIYFLPESPNHLHESIVDLRDLHTLPRLLLDELQIKEHRLCRIESPYREHLAQHFSVTYSRIALPEPYQTKA